MATTPIPRWDVPRLHRAEFLSLFGAGREKRIYAVPPHTDVEPLTFDDVAFEVERTPGAAALAAARRTPSWWRCPPASPTGPADGSAATRTWCERGTTPGGDR
jgi:hypothetical protein